MKRNEKMNNVNSYFINIVMDLTNEIINEAVGFTHKKFNHPPHIGIIKVARMRIQGLRQVEQLGNIFIMMKIWENVINDIEKQCNNVESDLSAFKPNLFVFRDVMKNCLKELKDCLK